MRCIRQIALDCFELLFIIGLNSLNNSLKLGLRPAQ